MLTSLHQPEGGPRCKTYFSETPTRYLSYKHKSQNRKKICIFTINTHLFGGGGGRVEELLLLCAVLHSAVLVLLIQTVWKNVAMPLCGCRGGSETERMGTVAGRKLIAKHKQ